MPLRRCPADLCPFTSLCTPTVADRNVPMYQPSHAPSSFELARRRDANTPGCCTLYEPLLSLRLQSHSRVRFFGGLGGGSDLHRDFHSTPDLNVQSSSLLAPKGHRSQEDVNALNGRNGLPPPNHPPPPPPVGQVVKVNVGANVPDVVTPASVYDNMAHIQQVKGRSSFFRHLACMRGDWEIDPGSLKRHDRD